MKYKEQYDKICLTLNEKKFGFIDDYYNVLHLKRQGYSNPNIMKKLNLTRDQIYDWLYRNRKPISVQRFELLKRKNYFDDEFIDGNLEWLAYLVGYNLGDGNISRNFCQVWFYGVNSDLEKIKEILLKFKVKPRIYTYQINNGKMVVNDIVFSRFLYSFGAIVGDKTKSNYTVPNWIFKSKKGSILKRRFLQGLCDSELSRMSQLKDRRFSFRTLKYYMVKEKHYIKKGVNYLDQLRKLFLEFGITTTEVKKDRVYIRGRDNLKMIQLYFIIHSNYINLASFFDKIGFLYTSSRIVDSEILLKIKDLSKLEKKKVIKYNNVLKLRKEGLSAYKIAKKLNLPIYHVKNWLYKNHKPRSLAY